MTTRNIVSDPSHPMINNRSKKNLNQMHPGGYQNLQMQNGLYNQGNDGNLKVRNYYDMLEKNRRNEKMQSDLTKIYMVNGVGQPSQPSVMVPSGGNYQSPSQMSPFSDSTAVGGPVLASSGNGQYYQQKRVSQAQSPMQHDNQNSLLPNNNHFHNRNQSIDVVNQSKLKSKI
mmetsp:Transcript_17865/g.30339  ORF Transcript_17865/g.30339 Transcript_17865/m.30339 type:complete len:172 (+) Transcript_17865:2465-2980(+)